MVTEDRSVYGFVGIMSVKDNVLLANTDQFASPLFIREKQTAGACEAICQKLRVKTPDIRTAVENLSGGNQQKVVLSKWLARSIKVLIMDEPTRGIDVGAKFEIYKLMTELAGQGLAIVMISSEMPEVIGMSHRVLVMSEGKIRAELDRDEATQERIMQIIVRGE